MKKVALLVVGLVLFSISSFAGEYLMNDTGETVYGLRVVFSEPVTLASFGDVFTAVEPAGESTEFIFSGGELEAWGGHWMNWEPAEGTLDVVEWLMYSPPSVHTSTRDYGESFHVAPLLDSSRLASDAAAEYTQIVPRVALLQVGETQHFRLLELFPEGGFRFSEDSVIWRSSSPVVGHFSSSVSEDFSAVQPGLTTISAQSEGITYTATVVVYSTKAAIDGKLPDWHNADWYQIPADFWEGEPIEIHKPGQGWVDSIPVVEATLFSDVEAIRTQAIAARYSEERFELAMQNRSRIDPEVGIWVDLQFSDSRLNRMLSMPQGTVVATGEEHVEVGDQYLLDAEFGVATLEVSIPWAKLELTPGNLALLLNIVVRFHEQLDSSDGTQYIELIHYFLPSKFVTYQPLDPDNALGSVTTTSPQLPQVGERVGNA